MKRKPPRQEGDSNSENVPSFVGTRAFQLTREVGMGRALGRQSCASRKRQDGHLPGKAFPATEKGQSISCWVRVCPCPKSLLVPAKEGPSTKDVRKISSSVIFKDEQADQPLRLPAECYSIGPVGGRSAWGFRSGPAQ